MDQSPASPTSSEKTLRRRAMARLNACRSSAPECRTNRCLSIDLRWLNCIAPCRPPYVVETLNREASDDVSGATITVCVCLFIGEGDKMTHGRVFPISHPIAGSKRAIQISPRFSTFTPLRDPRRWGSAAVESAHPPCRRHKSPQAVRQHWDTTLLQSYSRRSSLTPNHYPVIPLAWIRGYRRSATHRSKQMPKLSGIFLKPAHGNAIRRRAAPSASDLHRRGSGTCAGRTRGGWPADGRRRRPAHARTPPTRSCS